MPEDSSKNQDLSHTEAGFIEAAKGVGKSPEELRAYLASVVSGPYVGRPEECMSRKRVYALAVGTKRAMTNEERLHLADCEFCGDEFSLFMRLADKKAAAARKPHAETPAVVGALVGIAAAVVGVWAGFERLVSGARKPRRVSLSGQAVAAAAMPVVSGHDPEPVRRRASGAGRGV